MPSQPLTPEQRQVVLAAVWNALRARDSTLFERGRLKQPGGIVALDENLDVLIDMAREMTADRIEPYLARIIDDICGHCEQQEPSGYCPLRHEDKCALFGQARLILETIDSVLRELKDPEFMATRGGAAGS
jgi:hypothetical protein